MDKLVIKKVRVDLTNESSVLDDTAQQVPETCSSVSQTVSTNCLPLQSPHSSARFVDCDGVDSRQELQQTSDKSLLCPYQPHDIAYPAQDIGKLTKGGQAKRRYFNKEW